MHADGDTVWIGTTRGIALWNGNQIAGSVPDIGTASPFRSNFISGIVERGDTLFVSTLSGVWQARLSQNLATWSEEDIGFPDSTIDGMVSYGGQPFALAGGVVYAWSEADSSWSATTSLGSLGHVDKLRSDFGTMLAVSSFGLFRWNGTQWTTVENGRGSGSGATQSEFGSDPDGVIFNTHLGTLLEQSGTAWITHTPPGPVSNSILNILHDGTYAWLATDGGFGRFDGTTWRSYTQANGTAQDTSFASPGNAIMLQLDAQGRLWTSNWSAVIERVDASTNPMHVDHVYVGSPDPKVASPRTWGWSGAVDSWGDVYVGSDTPQRTVAGWEPNGIDVYDTNAQRIVNWKATTTGMAGDEVRALAVDKFRVLWAGFAGAGVSWAALDSTDSHSSAAGNDHLRLPVFQAVASLATSDIFGVVAHGDSLWVLTTSDLERIRPSSTTKAVASRYEIPAGPAPRGAVHPLDVAPDGTVWVGSVDGVRRYLPGGGSQDYRVDNSPLADNEVRSLYVEQASGAVWIGTASGVNRFDPYYTAPPPPAISRLTLSLWPNPATLNASGIAVRLGANTPAVAGEVFDLGGRRVSRFGAVPSGGVVWDGRDADGGLVRAGVYFVHASGGGREATARIVVLR
jgi:ligand-binding sensor domain-containing protein